MFVRRAAVSDIPFIGESLRAICNYHYEGRPDLFRHDGVKYTAEELVGVLKDSIVLIAEDDGGQCGYLIAQPREYSADDNRNKYKSIYVDDLFVSPSSRHGGAGRLLMQAIFDEAKAMGCYNVTLNVWEFPGSAMKFYEALGMKPMAHTMELILDKKEKTQMTIGEFLINTKGEFESDLAELVAIDSVAGEPDGVYPYGKGSAAALDAMLSIAEKYGFRTENHDYHCGSVLYGDSEKEVGIIAHLDVVPASADGWSTESPFVLTKRGECIIGRGTRDDKGPALMGLYTMRYFKENGIRLPFTIRLVLGCDEEVGSTDLEYFKKVRSAPWFSFTPDSDFPVCIGEKGIMSFTLCLGDADKSIVALHGGSVSNAVPGDAFIELTTDADVPAAEHITAVRDGGTVRITAKGVTAHASAPEHGLNAVWLLADYLIKNGLVPASDADAFDFLREAEGEYLGKTFGIDFSDEYFGYLTCIGGVLSLKDGKIYINFNVRFPMSRSFEQVFAGVIETAGSRGYEITDSNRGSSHAEGYFKQPDSPEIKALQTAFEAVTKTHEKPYTMGGGTYARGLANTVAFGASQSRYAGLLGEGKGNCHDVDEYISEKEVSEGIEIYIRALQGLAEI